MVNKTLTNCSMFVPNKLNSSHSRRAARLTQRSTYAEILVFRRILGESTVTEAVQAQSSELPVREAADCDIEFAQLEELAQIIAPAQMRELMTSFDPSFEATHEKLKAAAAIGDLETARCEAHDLKSITGSFGLRRLQHLAENIESACASGDASEVICLVPEIAVCWAVARNLLANFKLASAASA